jgi:Bifunctional DNA primase/polymerase, N-terminal
MNREEYLEFYITNGFSIIPVRSKQKAPTVSNWQNRHPNDFDPAEFSGETNVGLVLGKNSGGLVDIDLDCEEALAIAPIFLPTTGFKFGRSSKPNSHHFYRCPTSQKTVRLTGTDGRTLLECRGDGAQTVVPPSTPATGELIEFGELGDPG